EADSDIALRWLDRHLSGEVALIAPDLLLTEFASLAAKLHRRKELSAEQADEAFKSISRLAPRLFETQPLLSGALTLSLRHQISLWDCVYLALANEHGCPMLTADLRLLRCGAARHASIQALA